MTKIMKKSDLQKSKEAEPLGALLVKLRNTIPQGHLKEVAELSGQTALSVSRQLRGITSLKDITIKAVQKLKRREEKKKQLIKKIVNHKK